ncbi:MAG TPA: transglutaminase family protein [Candidatus Cybelea sp.]|nr:transglutaminase family protein [Candidatus Cybelea sp.]
MSEADGTRQALDVYLRPTWFIDSDDARIRAFATEAVGDATDDVTKAVRLYYAVRDRITYDPYRVELTPQGFRASDCLAKGYGFCILKATLLAAAGRAAGVPSRLGFADVKNHLATARLKSLMKTDIFFYHGYTEFFLDGRWVKATPAFNIQLCDRFRVLPLEFDGHEDSIFHPFDADGRQHMEYVGERGSFADMPFAEIEANFREVYGELMGRGGPKGDFAAEAAAESRLKS